MPNAGRSGRVYTDIADDELYAAICGSDLARLGVNRDATLRIARAFASFRSSGRLRSRSR